MARKMMGIGELAREYGCSLNRMHVILNSDRVTTKTVGKLALALKCDVLEIIETEGGKQDE